MTDGTLFAVSAGFAEQIPMLPGQPGSNNGNAAATAVEIMALSADEKILACFTKRGHLHVLDVQARACLHVINTKVQKQPNQMIWCGMRVGVLLLCDT